MLNASVSQSVCVCVCSSSFFSGAWRMVNASVCVLPWCGDKAVLQNCCCRSLLLKSLPVPTNTHTHTLSDVLPNIAANEMMRACQINYGPVRQRKSRQHKIAMEIAMAGTKSGHCLNCRNTKGKKRRNDKEGGQWNWHGRTVQCFWTELNWTGLAAVAGTLQRRRRADNWVENWRLQREGPVYPVTAAFFQTTQQKVE